MANDLPLVSVVMPIYNGERHLSEALSSLRAQTYGNFECICIDDGSTDSSASVAEWFADEDTRFILVKQRNQGVAATRNKGLDLSRGAFVAFLDQDDALVPTALERQVSVIQETGCDVVCSGIHEFHGDGIPPSISAEASGCVVSHTPLNDFFGFNATARIGVNVWGKLYRREALAGLRFPDGVFGADDYVFTSRVCSHISSHAVVDVPLYLYRMHGENVTSQMPMRYIMGTLRSREIVWNEMLESPLVDVAMRNFISRSFAYDIMSWAIKKTCRREYPENEMSVLREYTRRLLSLGVLAPSSLRDKVKCKLFLSGRRRLMRLLFPRQFGSRRHGGTYGNLCNVDSTEGRLS